MEQTNAKDVLISLFEQFSPEKAARVLLSEFTDNFQERARRLVILNMLVAWAADPAGNLVQRTARASASRIIGTIYRKSMRGDKGLHGQGFAKFILALAQLLPLAALALGARVKPSTRGENLTKEMKKKSEEAHTAILVTDLFLRAMRFSTIITKPISINRAAHFIQRGGYADCTVDERTVRDRFKRLRPSAALLFAFHRSWQKPPNEIVNGWIRAKNLFYDHSAVVGILSQADAVARELRQKLPSGVSDQFFDAPIVSISQIDLAEFTTEELKIMNENRS